MSTTTSQLGVFAPATVTFPIDNPANPTLPDAIFAPIPVGGATPLQLQNPSPSYEFADDTLLTNNGPGPGPIWAVFGSGPLPVGPNVPGAVPVYPGVPTLMTQSTAFAATFTPNVSPPAAVPQPPVIITGALAAAAAAATVVTAMTLSPGAVLTVTRGEAKIQTVWTA